MVLMHRFKQSGPEALAADNVFHHLTYEGAVDVETIADSHTRLAMEAQINEFGQCPGQLFTVPHPCRVSIPSVADAHKISAGEAVCAQGSCGMPQPSRSRTL